MATLAASLTGPASSKFYFLASEDPQLSSRNFGTQLFHASSKTFRPTLLDGCSSYQQLNVKTVLGTGKRQSIVCFYGYNGAQEREGLMIRSSDVFAKDESVSSDTLWRKIKKVTRAILLSTLISLPAVDSVWAVESFSVPALESPASEAVRDVEKHECPGKSVTGLEGNESLSAGPVTNESVVDEAWQVVNENFLDARRHWWSGDYWQKVKEDALKRPLQTRMAAYVAIKGMLANLKDPYTRFLTPAQIVVGCLITVQELAKYDVTGVGINIGQVEDGKGHIGLEVLGVVLGSPAQLMGVRQGDELLAVNGTSVEGMSAFEAASLIQGPKGTPVSIEIKHGPCEDVTHITVSRQQDVHTPVFYRIEHTSNPEELTGYIRLHEFNALATRDLAIAVKRLQDAGATSFMLDLQDNPGGLVQAGIEIARLFLNGGEMVIETVGRDPRSYQSIVATGEPVTKAPLMVLVNNRTASASEIVAAALHDNCRAILVGKRTFGKGLIQSVFELSDGSGIILTVGKYVTPGKVDIDGNGIEPDFKIRPGLSEAKQKLGMCELRLKHHATASTSF